MFDRRSLCRQGSMQYKQAKPLGVSIVRYYIFYFYFIRVCVPCLYISSDSGNFVCWPLTKSDRGRRALGKRERARKVFVRKVDDNERQSVSAKDRKEWRTKFKSRAVDCPSLTQANGSIITSSKLQRSII